jgi:hypothetical protein
MAGSGMMGRIRCLQIFLVLLEVFLPKKSLRPLKDLTLILVKESSRFNDSILYLQFGSFN